jgi:hypothetical protein
MAFEIILLFAVAAAAFLGGMLFGYIRQKRFL